MIGYIVYITVCIIVCASVVPVCQYIYHIRKTRTPVYKFPSDLFEQHLHTPLRDDIDQKIAQELNIPLP